jgi:hypothetical protein
MMGILTAKDAEVFAEERKGISLQTPPSAFSAFKFGF